MAIQFARARYISRSTGGSAVRSAAYNERAAITVGAHRRAVLLQAPRRAGAPRGAVARGRGGKIRRQRGAVERGGGGGAAQGRAGRPRDRAGAAGRMPASPHEDRIDLARSFAEQHFVAKGLAVQLDVHAPHEGESESERANWHAHLLITTRRIEGEGFAAKKARDLDPEVRRAGGRAVVADGEAWGELWRDHQNRYFVEHGLGIRVDPTATHAQEHIGPVRMRKAGFGDRRTRGDASARPMRRRRAIPNRCWRR